MRLFILQYGDFAEAWRRFADGGAETYRDQRASVDYVAGLAERGDVTTLAIGERAHDETLAPGLRSVGITPEQAARPGVVAGLVRDLAPTLAVARTPHREALATLAVAGVPTLPAFADIFGGGGPRRRWQTYRLARTLRAPVFPCVANHSLNATRSLIRGLGVPPARAVPWDWSRLPVAPARKSAPVGAFEVVYAGLVAEAKGVGDLIAALGRLKTDVADARLTVFGPGDAAPFRKAAEAAGVTGQIDFPGRLAHPEVRAAMERAGAVVVPSRHSYPEGLPNVIYEALAARAPLVVSDHPAFAGRLTDGRDALVFPAGDPSALAERLARIARTPELGLALSEAGEAAHDALYLGTEWTRLVETFLADPADATGWVGAHALPAVAPEALS